MSNRDDHSVFVEILEMMLDCATPVSDEPSAPTYKRYHIESGDIGFSISAHKHSSIQNGAQWHIRTWSTYNA